MQKPRIIRPETSPGISLACCIVISALAGVGGCQQTRTSDQDIKPINYTRFVDLLANEKQETIVVDVRPQRLRKNGYLPNSINIPLPELTAGDRRLANAQNIVVYGSDWTDPLAPAAAKRLIALGYQNVYELRGGVAQWDARGQPVIRDENVDQPGETAATPPPTEE